MPTADLIALAERVEKALGADARLGAEVEIAMRGFPERAYQRHNGMRPKGAPPLDRLEWAAGWFGAGPTASIDAAMSLVPEGGTWMLASADPNEGDVDGPQLPFCTVVTTVDAYHAIGSTPALALTAAALRASSASNG